MTLTPDQIGQIVTVLVILGAALANYLNHLSTKTASANVQAKVDDVHAATTGGLPVTPPPLPLVDGHEIPPFQKPPARPLP
jgi:hypothetical protein